MSHLTACDFAHVTAGAQLSNRVEERRSMKATRGSGIAGVEGPGPNLLMPDGLIKRTACR